MTNSLKICCSLVKIPWCLYRVYCLNRISQIILYFGSSRRKFGKLFLHKLGAFFFSFALCLNMVTTNGSRRLLEVRKIHINECIFCKIHFHLSILCRSKARNEPQKSKISSGCTRRCRDINPDECRKIGP